VEIAAAVTIKLPAHFAGKRVEVIILPDHDQPAPVAA